MKILLLGPSKSPLVAFLRDIGCSVIPWNDPLDIEFLRNLGGDFAISYRYRHLVRKEAIEYFQENIINLHISFLPWNRGADPNLWSFLDDTPKGVTIHYLDEGVDTGDIITQRKVVFASQGETLASTYRKLNEELINLFTENWAKIASAHAPSFKQPPGGSFHRSSDKKKFLHLLSEKGWGTPVAQIIGRALDLSERGTYERNSYQ